MPFNRTLAQKIGSTPVNVYSCTADGTVLIGCRVSNRTASAIKVNALVSTDSMASGNQDYYLVGGPTVSTMGADVAAGGAQALVSGDADKIILKNGDKVYVSANTATSTDVLIAVLEP